MIRETLSVGEMFEPMCNYIPKELWDDLMFIGIQEDKIFQYKHHMTRHYVNVDNQGNFYSYDCVNESYNQVTKNEALKNIFS